MEVLSSWSVSRLGLREVTWPYPSLYVSGCRQNLHNDTGNGDFAFVYSLTRNDRRSTGGETIVLHEGDLFRRHLATAQAGRGLFDAIEPRFNRLVVFDDRLVHGVERVEGAMDPREAASCSWSFARRRTDGLRCPPNRSIAVNRVWNVSGCSGSPARLSRADRTAFRLRRQDNSSCAVDGSVTAAGAMMSAGLAMDELVATLSAINSRPRADRRVSRSCSAAHRA